MTNFLNSTFVELIGWIILTALALNTLAGTLMLAYAAACLLAWPLKRLSHRS